MCALGIDKLRQYPAEILLLWRDTEEHAFRAHVPVNRLVLDVCPMNTDSGKLTQDVDISILENRCGKKYDFKCEVVAVDTDVGVYPI